MSNTNGLRALGLSFLTVFGFMALVATVAQGQATGKFLDLVGGVAKELAVGTTATGAQEGTGSLLAHILNLTIQCGLSHITVTVEVAGPPPNASASASIQILNCLVLTADLKPLGSCKVGESKTIKGNALLLARLAGPEHSSVPFVLAEPATGTEFAKITIENETGKFCSLSGTYPVTGTLALKVLAGHVNPQLVVPYTNQALLGDAGLKFGVNAATLDASATIELTGVGAGLIKTPFGVC